MATKTRRKLALRTETLRRLQNLDDGEMARVAGGTYVPVPPYVPDVPEYDEIKYRLTGGNSYDSRCG